MLLLLFLLLKERERREKRGSLSLFLHFLSLHFLSLFVSLFPLLPFLPFLSPFPPFLSFSLPFSLYSFIYTPTTSIPLHPHPSPPHPSFFYRWKFVFLEFVQILLMICRPFQIWSNCSIHKIKKKKKFFLIVLFFIKFQSHIMVTNLIPVKLHLSCIIILFVVSIMYTRRVVFHFVKWNTYWRKECRGAWRKIEKLKKSFCSLFLFLFVCLFCFFGKQTIWIYCILLFNSFTYLT